jgi:hypothetical protein
MKIEVSTEDVKIYFSCFDYSNCLELDIEMTLSVFHNRFQEGHQLCILIKI